MSRYILGDCVQVMSRFPARLPILFLPIPRIWLAIRTVPAVPWPGTTLPNGSSPPVMKCTAC